MATKFWLASTAVKRSKDETSIKPYSDIKRAFSSNFSAITISVRVAMFNGIALKVALLQAQVSIRGLVYDVGIRCFHNVDASDQLAKLNQPALSCAGRRGRRTANVSSDFGAATKRTYASTECLQIIRHRVDPRPDQDM